MLLVWLVPFLLGIAYVERDGSAQGLPVTNRALWCGAVGGLGTTAALVALGPYPASMIGMPGATVSNLAPPTVVALTLAVGQISLLVLARDALLRLTRPGTRGAAVVAWVSERSMTLYLWHLTAMIVVVGVAVVGAGLVLPGSWSAGWWLTRPAWLLACVGVLALLVRGFGRFEGVAPAREAPRRPGLGTPKAATLRGGPPPSDTMRIAFREAPGRSISTCVRGDLNPHALAGTGT